MTTTYTFTCYQKLTTSDQDSSSHSVSTLSSRTGEWDTLSKFHRHLPPREESQHSRILRAILKPTGWGRQQVSQSVTFLLAPLLPNSLQTTPLLDY